MRTGCNVFLVIFCLVIAGLLGRAQAHAQTIRGSATIALKSGESVEVGEVYYTINCRSLLKSAPEVEVLEGPPGVTATIKEGMVLPRVGNCAKRVLGGTLVLTAKDIEDPSYTPLTLRFIYKTKDGERKFSQVFNLSLLPCQGSVLSRFTKCRLKTGLSWLDASRLSSRGSIGEAVGSPQNGRALRARSQRASGHA